MRQLGLRKADQDNKTAINNHIDNLKFDLVILTEDFDEGIVLLKRKLCWHLENILYVKLRDSSKKRSSHKALSKIEKQANSMIDYMHNFYKEWSRTDYILYNRMNNTFWQKYNQEANIDEEVVYFKETRMKEGRFCKGALQFYGEGQVNK